MEGPLEKAETLTHEQEYLGNNSLIYRIANIHRNNNIFFVRFVLRQVEPLT